MKLKWERVEESYGDYKNRDRCFMECAQVEDGYLLRTWVMGPVDNRFVIFNMTHVDTRTE